MTQKKEIQKILWALVAIDTMFCLVSIITMSIINSPIRLILWIWGVALLFSFGYILFIYIFINREKRARYFHYLLSIGCVFSTFPLLVVMLAYHNVSFLGFFIWIFTLLLVVYFSYLDGYRKIFKIISLLISSEQYFPETESWTLAWKLLSQTQSETNSRWMKYGIMLLLIINPLVIFLSNNINGFFNILFVILSLAFTFTYANLTGGHLAFAKVVSVIEWKRNITISI